MKKYRLLLLLPLTFLMVNLAKKMPHLTEMYYSTGFYPVISKVLGLATGFFSFSLGEVLLMVLIIYIIFKVITGIIKIINKPENAGKLLLSALWFIVAFSVSIYFFFNILWGFNYYRLDYPTITAMTVLEPQTDDLVRLSKILMGEANHLREHLKEDDRGRMVFDHGLKDTLKRAALGYKEASEEFPQLSGTHARPKMVILSPVMAYAGIGGIFFPLTGEPNVNIKAPPSTIPHTACHELAHQIGFAREDEANFIGYVACIMHPDYDYRYSGVFFALRYTMGELYSRDRDAWNILAREYGPGILRDMEQLREYNQKYSSRLTDVSETINDMYLKSNSQTEGVKSYDLVINLLVAHYLYND